MQTNAQSCAIMNRMHRLFLVRHGETDWNRLRKLQGHTDIELNPRGVLQAQGLRELLQHHRPTRLLSSDLKRAQRTAQEAFPHLRPSLTPLLREIHLGGAEGKSREQVQLDFGEQVWSDWSQGQFSKYSTRFPSGESRREGLERLFQFLKSFESSTAPEVIFGFTHGLLLRSFAQWTENLEEATFTTPNCCVYEWDLPHLDLNFESDPALRPRLRQILLLPDESLSL